MTIWYRIKYGAEWTLTAGAEMMDAHVRAMLQDGKKAEQIRIIPIPAPEQK